MNRIILIIIIGFLLSACGVGAPGVGTDNKSSLEVLDQDIAIYTRIKIKQLELDRDSFLLIQQRDLLGRPGEILGARFYEAGTYIDEEMILEQAVTLPEGDTQVVLYALIYVDGNADGKFDFASDELALNPHGQSIGKTFELRDTPNSVHVKLRLGANGNTAYTWQPLVDDQQGFDISDVTGTILLRRGWRYEITHDFAEQHPLEFLDGDNKVVWTEEAGDRFILFIDETLAEEIVSFRCKYHPAMSGSVDIE